MPRRSAPRPLFALALLALFASAQATQDKTLLVLKGTVGETSRRHSEVAIKIEAEGQKLNLEQKEDVVVTVKSVGADGSLTTLHKVESTSRSVNGEKIPSGEEELDEYTATQTARGFLTSYEPKKKDDDDTTHLNERMFQAGTVVFSTAAVGKGDKWTVDYDSNAKLGLPKAKGEYSVELFEDVDGVKCAKVKLDYRELEGAHKVEFIGVTWIEVSSGDEVKSEFTANNIELGSDESPVLGSATGVGKRVSGGTVKGAQGVKPADPAAPPKKEEEDNIDKKVKDFEKLPGLFTFFKRVKDGRQQVYLELREDQLEKPFMLQATASTGSGDGRVAAGDPISDTMFLFRKLPNDRVYLAIPNHSVRAPKSAEAQRSLERSFPDQLVESFRIEAKQPDRQSVLLDVSGFFLGDFASLSSALIGPPGPGAPMMAGSAPDRERSFLSELKSFPTNVFAQTTFVFQGRKQGDFFGGPSYSGDGRGMVLKLDYNLFPLTDEGYTPRSYDSRVGFFTTDHMDFSSEAEMEKRKQVILRWNLKKKDPKAAVSEPVTPITFWLDNAVPKEWRPTVAEALLQWNGAFERIGFKDAVVVKQMSDAAEFDHADMRYNVIRWVSSPGSAYAVALARSNPLTGQIINASITVDSNMVRFGSDEQETYKGAASRWAKLAEGAPSVSEAKPALSLTTMARCSYAKEAVAHRDLGLVAAELATPFEPGTDAKKEYVRQFLKEVVGHEFGHILGLRHNFAASTELSNAELADANQVRAKGNSASLMDYLPFNHHALSNKDVPYYSQVVGTYDRWAVEYGYRDFPSISAEDEVRQLKNLASQTNEPGKRYLSDEFADGVDPYVTRFDSGKDPLDYYEDMAGLTKKMLGKLGDRYPKHGESYASFARAFNQTLNNHVNNVFMGSFFIGGVRKNPNFRGDANEQPPIQSVDAASQRRALTMVDKYIFTRGALSFPKKYYTMLAPNPKNSYAMVNEQDFEFVSFMEFVQRIGVMLTMSPRVLARLMDQEFKAETPGLTAGEVVSTVDRSVWAELASGAEPDLLRRSLQRSHVDTLVSLALDGGSSGELRQLGRTNLRSLLTRLKGSKAEGATKAHYADLAVRIQNVLEAKPTIRP